MSRKMTPAARAILAALGIQEESRWSKFVTFFVNGGWLLLGLLALGLGIYFNPPREMPIFGRPTPTAIGLGLGGNAQQVQLPPTPEATLAPPVGGYPDIRQPKGIKADYLYTERVVEDNGILRGSTRDQPDLNLPPQWPVSAKDKVAVLEEWTNEHGRWLRIVIVTSAIDPHFNGKGGWVLAWLIDEKDVPPRPTPTVEAPTAEPTPTGEAVPTVEEPTQQPPTPEPSVEVIETPAATPTDPFEPTPVVFNKESVTSTGKVAGGEARGCVDGFVKVQSGPMQATVQFTLGEDVKSTDVDSNGHYRICDMSSGDWAGIVLTLGGEPYDDADSAQTVTVVEGDVSTASWYEKEPEF